MITEDLASAVGLSGGMPEKCPFCQKIHTTYVGKDLALVCKCGAIQIVSEDPAGKLSVVWLAAAIGKERRERTFGDLPHTN